MMPLAKRKIPALALLAATSLVGASAALSPGQPVPVQGPAKTVVKAADPQDEPPYLLAPRNLAATSGSGQALMDKLDAKGERIANPQGRFQQVEKDLRWVVVVGLLDHELIRQRWAKAVGGDVADFRVDYEGVDLELERQVRQPDGSWSEWTALNQKPTRQILDNLAETSPEKIPELARPRALVAPLPVLKKGTWEGVNPSDVTFNRQVLAKPRPAPKQGQAQPAHDPIVMIRAVDFFPEAGKTCRYRARLVFNNPRAASLAPRFRQTLGLWSEPTAEVLVP